MTATVSAERPSLRELQEVFWKLISAPEGARPGADTLVAAGELREGQVDEWFAGDERRTAIDRVDVYANMYFYRLKDALREDFPKTIAILGEDRYNDLITDFLLAHPSRRPSMRWVGEPLPAFLRSHPIGAELPHAADLADLEWRRTDAFQQVDAPRLAAADLASVPPESWGDLVFTPIPALSLLATEWDVDTLWDRLDEEDEPGEIERRPLSFVIYRPELVVFHRVLGAEEATALRALVDGRPFGELCAALATDDDDVDAAAGRAAAFLMRWLEDGLLSGFAIYTGGS